MWSWIPRRRPLAEPGRAPASDARRDDHATEPVGLLRYRIERRIGQGAAAQVFLAQDRRSGQWVALKLLELAVGASDPERQDALERFRREATVLHELHHPGIVRLLDAGPTEHGAWMALEVVPGCDLSRYTRPARLLPPSLVASTGARIAEALGHAHRHGVIHRDVKPANVLVDWATDTVKLGDFGLARTGEHTQTRSGVTLGSPDYMAPEQLAGAAAGPAADVYGLGATLYELLAGRRPHQSDNLGALLRAVASEPVPELAQIKPGLDAALCALVMQMLAKDPAARPSDAQELASRLRTASQPGAAAPP